MKYIMAMQKSKYLESYKHFDCFGSVLS